MRLIEAWRLSRVPFRETVYRSLAEERGRMWWGAFGRSRFDQDSQSDVELTKRALRIARFDKLIVSVFSVVASILPFTSLFSGSSGVGLSSSVSLSLAVAFGFTALYAIQTFSSFVSAESSALLSTLPLATRDVSWITLFSFMRSVDYMVFGTVLCQVALVAYLTASPVAVALMFVASVLNVVFAVALSLWFSRLFYANMMRGGRSKRGTFLRLIFILMWGSLLLSVGLLLSVPWYIVPQMGRALSNLDQVSNLLLLIVYPFAAGLTVGNSVYPSVAFPAVIAVSAVMMGYVIVAAVAGRWTMRMVEHISRGTGVKIGRAETQDFSVKPRGPLLGYVVKDLKVSSRNPATAFFFALPVLETLIVSMLITNFQMLRASTILVATVTGGFFALLMPLALLNAEGTGLEYTKTLPVSAKNIVTSKTLVSTASYLPVPLTLFCLAFIKQMTSPLLIVIPFVTLMTIAAASIVEIKLFLGSAAKGRIAGLARDLEKLVSGVAVILVPEIVYTMVYLSWLGHVSAILAMSIAALAELTLAAFVLKRS